MSDSSKPPKFPKSGKDSPHLPPTEEGDLWQIEPPRSEAPQQSSAAAPTPKSPDTPPSETAKPPTTEPAKTVAPEQAPAAKKDSAEQVVKPFLQSLSKFEVIGIASIITVLLIAFVSSIIVFNQIIEVEPLIPQGLELPIQGQDVTITAVDTYWRKPITEGDNQDVFRRGSKLLPVVNIEIENSSMGALRFLFRDGQGNLIGDNINREISGNKIIEVAATAGFNDLGMHASYRTGDSERWTVQVLEGPSVRAPIEEFKTVFKTEISSVSK